MKDIVQKINAFNKRWDLVPDGKYEDEFRKFKFRVLNIFHDIDCHVTEEVIGEFCQLLGIIQRRSDYGELHSGNHIIHELIDEDNEKKFYKLLQVISYLSICEEYGRRGGIPSYSKRLLFQRLAEAIELSSVNLAMVFQGEEVVLFPAGEKKFDKELVDEVLSFLSGACQRHFIEALKFFQEKKSHKSSESLRRALEEYLRMKLVNRQGLEKNILELQKKLKLNDSDASIRDVIFQVFSYLDKYFNENSKHNDGLIREPENEYLIYQVGLLMRYIHGII